ncbi:MAG: phenylacetic acid degradation protein PaaN, partial [Bacteroidota bacterium]|nr:phenylacetic acid degradation protein PaaN [Bacteroidota bacterium]MDX5430112.1 phenylacetic acid degradation protein PaaN [Bacteroidota bacterium]MDX5468873.1 phenylacetic acid degradation protein PaaN [Bacteroidota bacterium]
MSQALSLFERHEATLRSAIEAIHDRGFWTPYPEHPKAYGETGDEDGKAAFSRMMNEDFKELLQEGEQGFIGEEVSPYLQLGLGIKYPQFSADQLIERADAV